MELYGELEIEKEGRKTGNDWMLGERMERK
jgi:hypothetical protein